jgi:hypothetical protein
MSIEKIQQDIQALLQAGGTHPGATTIVGALLAVKNQCELVRLFGGDAAALNAYALSANTLIQFSEVLLNDLKALPGGAEMLAELHKQELGVSEDSAAS